MFSATGGGQRTTRPMSPSFARVGAVAAHMATRVPNPFDSDGAHATQAVLSMQPASILTSMVTPSYEDTTEPVQEQLTQSLTTVGMTGEFHPSLVPNTTCGSQRQLLQAALPPTLSAPQWSILEYVIRCRGRGS